MVTRASKVALRYLNADSPSELVKCKAVISTSGKASLVLVNKKDLAWARKVHSNTRAYVIEPNMSFEYPDTHKFHGEYGHRGDKTAWVFGPSVRCIGGKK